VIPVLIYPDVREAAAWLCEAFGFRVRLRIGERHRVQMHAGATGAVIVAEGDAVGTDAVLIRIEDMDAHFERAVRSGAEVVNPPTLHMFGERQYSVRDFAGRRWHFTETVTDVAPEEWGGITE